MKTLQPRCICILNPRRPVLQRPAGTLRELAFLAQNGAGLFIYDGGVANLDGCNVYSNKAQGAGTYSTSDGGGLYVNGVANLNGCQVYENVAQNVRDRPRPLPRTFLQRPAGTLHMLAFCACSMPAGSTSEARRR